MMRIQLNTVGFLLHSIQVCSLCRQKQQMNATDFKIHFLKLHSMTKSLWNDSRISDVITESCLSGCHDTLQAQIVLLQKRQHNFQKCGCSS